MSESKLENQIRDYLLDNGAYVEKIWGGGYQAAGIPDLIACYKGIFLGIEVKFGNNAASKIQEAKIMLINKAGGYGLVTWDLESVKKIIKEIDNGHIKGRN